MPLVAGCARGVAAAARSVGSAGCQHAEWVVRVCELKWVQPPPPPGAARGGARKPSGGCRHRGARRARPRACCPLPRSCRECCKPVGARASPGCEFAPSGRHWRIGRPPPLGLETGPPPAPLRRSPPPINNPKRLGGGAGRWGRPPRKPPRKSVCRTHSLPDRPPSPPRPPAARTEAASPWGRRTLSLHSLHFSSESQPRALPRRSPNRTATRSSNHGSRAAPPDLRGAAGARGAHSGDPWQGPDLCW